MRHAPYLPKLRRTESNSHSGVAQHICAHKSTIAVREAPGRIHFAKEICSECGAFIRWLPRPETIERQKLNAFKLARLAMRPDLTDWERQFIRSVGEKKHLSPKQQALIARLVTQYLEAKAP